MDTREASELMDAFADRTGLTSDEEQTRYLWTDAFAVCNYLGLARETGEDQYVDRARSLVEKVHRTLGRHRDDEPRQGWISGLSDEEGAEHPTAGGLRIGKPLPERKADEPFNERLEWDRDGQYFHYLTKWMHALDLMTRATGEPRYNVWARELGERAYDRFTYVKGGERRMYWKMSIDLSRAQVPSMGAHDPLDGWVTYQQADATAEHLSDEFAKPDLDDEVEGFASMTEGRDWTTTDPLGLGGLLLDAARLSQLESLRTHAQLLAILRSVNRGLERWARSGALDRPAPQRLAFRELGLAIGLAAVTQMVQSGAPITDSEIGEELVSLKHFVPMRERIVKFWLDPDHRAVETWTGHRDINEVMLATALAPAGCLELPHPE